MLRKLILKLGMQGSYSRTCCVGMSLSRRLAAACFRGEATSAAEDAGEAFVCSTVSRDDDDEGIREVHALRVIRTCGSTCRLATSASIARGFEVSWY